jgi:hypothetical protein
VVGRVLVYTPEIFFGNSVAAGLFFFVIVMGAITCAIDAMWRFSKIFRSAERQSLDQESEEYTRRFLLIEESAQYDDHVNKWRRIFLVFPFIFVATNAWLLVLLPKYHNVIVGMLPGAFIMRAYIIMEEDAKKSLEESMFGDALCFADSSRRPQFFNRLRQSEQLSPISWLIWPPLTALSLLPVFMNNINYSSRIAIGGAIICIIVAALTRIDIRKRALICTVVTIVCWGLMLGLNYYVL